MSVEILIRADSLSDSVEYPGPRSGAEMVNGACSEEAQIDSVEVAVDDSNELWKKSKVNIARNLLVLAMGCVFMQTAFMINNKEVKIMNVVLVDELVSISHCSTSSYEARLFAICMEIIMKILDCFIVPQYLIYRFGTKSTLLLSFSSYFLFYLTACSKFYPFNLASSFGIFLNQLFGNSFWVASLAYVAELSNLLVRLTAMGRELIVCLFFSIFYGLVNTSYLWKRLVGGDYPHEYESVVLNKSVNDSNDPIYNPETMRGFTLIILTLFGGLFMLVFLKTNDEKQLLNMVDMNKKQAKSIHQWLMVPSTLFVGLFQAFCYLFVNNKIDAKHDDMTPMLVYSLSMFVVAFILPFVRKLIGFNIMILMASFLNAIGILLIILVDLKVSSSYLLILTALLGVANAAMEITLACYYCLLFKGNHVPAYSYFTISKLFGVLIISSLAASSLLIPCLAMMSVLVLSSVFIIVIIYN